MASFLSLFDPTSSRSPFGGTVRSAIEAVPGGATALGIAEQTGRAQTNRSGTTARGGAATAAPAVASPWYTRPVVIVGALVAVVALVGVLLFRRR
jgi:hypothetical protein